MCCCSRPRLFARLVYGCTTSDAEGAKFRSSRFASKSRTWQPAGDDQKSGSAHSTARGVLKPADSHRPETDAGHATTVDVLIIPLTPPFVSCFPILEPEQQGNPSSNPKPDYILLTISVNAVTTSFRLPTPFYVCPGGAIRFSAPVLFLIHKILLSGKCVQ
jgi:hypothetical protein